MTRTGKDARKPNSKVVQFITEQKSDSNEEREKMYKLENYLLFIWKTEIIQLDKRWSATVYYSEWNFPLNKPPSSSFSRSKLFQRFQSHEYTTFLNKHQRQATAKNEHENFYWARKKTINNNSSNVPLAFWAGNIDLKSYILKRRERKHTHKRNSKQTLYLQLCKHARSSFGACKHEHQPHREQRVE